jgi:hypothetical protein
MLILSTLFFTVCGFSQTYNTQVEAKIELETIAGFIEIKGTAFNKTELNQSLRYVLSVIKNDPRYSNRSKNDQSGRFVLGPGQKMNLSRTTINANDKDRIIILLLVYNFNDELLGKDRIVINGNESDIIAANKKNYNSRLVSPDAKYEKDDGVVFRGIVIEDTKTKSGRDFYSMFSSSYIQKNINGHKIVTIKEALAIANNTKIQVFVDNTMVMEFLVRPQTEFLKTMMNEAIKRVSITLNNLEQKKNIVKHY